MKLTKHNIIDADLLLEFERLGCPDIEIPQVKRVEVYADTNPISYRVTTDTPVVSCSNDILHKMDIHESLDILKAYTNIDGVSYYTVSENKANHVLNIGMSRGYSLALSKKPNSIRFIFNGFIQYDIAILLSKKYTNGRCIQYTCAEKKRAKRIIKCNIILSIIKDLFRR